MAFLFLNVLLIVYLMIMFFSFYEEYIFYLFEILIYEFLNNDNEGILFILETFIFCKMFYQFIFIKTFLSFDVSSYSIYLLKFNSFIC